MRASTLDLRPDRIIVVIVIFPTLRWAYL